MATQDERNWAVGLHLSVFAGYLVPLAGLVAPVVIWMVKKDQSAYLDGEGKGLINMLITLLIALMVAGLLSLVLIGVPILILLGVYGVATPIIAAVKAANGQNFAYPWTIKFIK